MDTKDTKVKTYLIFVSLVSFVVISVAHQGVAQAAQTPAPGKAVETGETDAAADPCATSPRNFGPPGLRGGMPSMPSPVSARRYPR